MRIDIILSGELVGTVATVTLPTSFFHRGSTAVYVCIDHWTGGNIGRCRWTKTAWANKDDGSLASASLNQRLATAAKVAEVIKTTKEQP